MPIVTIQKRARELGRIRMGIQEPVKGQPGKTRPSKLDTFRLTSATREYVEAAAEVYLGEVRAWQSPRGPEWEVVIASPFLEVIIPPDQVIDQWYELWTGGGCQRRCDGITEQLSGQACLCPADAKLRTELAGKGKACKATTRLNVALPALPDLGVWRLETHSYYGAVELMGTAELLRQATAAGVLIRARLRIDKRQVQRPNEPRKDFIVPVLELPDLRLNAMLESGPVVATRQLGDGAPAAAPGRPALPPGPTLPAQSTLRPPAPATPDPDAEASAPIAAFDDAEEGVVVEIPALDAEAFRDHLREHGVVDGALVAAVKDELFGDQPRLTDEERGRLALEVIRRHGLAQEDERA